MCGPNPWLPGTEPSLDELLSDPIAVALLRSDGLTRRSVVAVLARARQALTRVAAGTPRSAPSIAPLRQAQERDAAPPRVLDFDFDAEPELTLTEG
ncbi:MAG TPA: hypothetical protein VF930_08495 [Stellaceae bacterium]